MAMDKATRDQLIADNQARISEIVADQTERRARRLANGDYDPLPTIMKSIRSDFDPLEAVAEIEYQQRRYGPAPQPQQQISDNDLVSRAALLKLLGEIGDEVSGELDKLYARVEKVEAEVQLMRSVAGGGVALIEGRRDAKSA